MYCTLQWKLVVNLLSSFFLFSECSLAFDFCIVALSSMEALDNEKRKRSRTMSLRSNSTPIMEDYYPYTSGILAHRLLCLRRRPASSQWDCYYRNNTVNGFKDRHYILREFPELQEAISASLSSTGPSSCAPTPSSDLSLDESCLSNFSWMEVGCGVGNAFFPIFEEYGHLPDWKRMYAVDISSVAINLLRKKIQISFPSSLQEKVYLATLDPSIQRITSLSFSSVLDSESVIGIENVKKQSRMSPLANRSERTYQHLTSISPLCSSCQDVIPTVEHATVPSPTAASTANSTSHSDWTPPLLPSHLPSKVVQDRPHVLKNISFASLIFVLSSVETTLHKCIIQHVAECLEQEDGGKPGILFFRDYAADDHAHLRFALRHADMHGALETDFHPTSPLKIDVNCCLSSKTAAPLADATSSLSPHCIANNNINETLIENTVNSSEGVKGKSYIPTNSLTSCTFVDTFECTSDKVPNAFTYERANGTLSHFFTMQEIRTLFTSVGFETISLQIVEREVINHRKRTTHHRRFIQGRFVYKH